MKSITDKERIKFAFAGILFGIIPVFYYGYWIYCTIVNEVQPDAVEMYINLLPPFLKNLHNSTIGFIIFCLIAIIMSAFALKTSNTNIKKINVLTLVLCSILTFLLLFQLM